MNDKKFIITTSWDDGSPSDKKLVGLLEKYSIKGTFYISKKFEYRPKRGNAKIVRASDEELKKIYRDFEVGAHSLTHKYFNNLNDWQIKEEVDGSKEYLENLFSREVKVFCYPGGRYDKISIEEVKKAGFIGARTTDIFKFDVGDPFLMPTTINCYPFPFGKGSARTKMRSFLKNTRLVINSNLPFKSFLNWQNLAKTLFDKAEEEKGVFHLWGHSWEIDKNNMWKALENALKYISGRKDALYLTNSETLEQRFNIR